MSETLPGHDGLVTCVRFISDAMFASADDKGTLICWRKHGSQAGVSYMISVNLTKDDVIFSGNLLERYRLMQGLFLHSVCLIIASYPAPPMLQSRYGSSNQQNTQARLSHKFQERLFDGMYR